MSRFERSRAIVERIVIEGELILLTPTLLGNGDADGLTDMSLLRDALHGSALLTGTSIAGALRNYLREHQHGYAVKEDKDSICQKLFGFIREKESDQSCLIIDDSLGEKPVTELRDGVRIKGETRTAFIDERGRGEKFDLELLEAGTTFKLRFELLLGDAKAKDRDGNEVRMFPPREELLKALATALRGFETGEIHLGARKRRGYGECRVENWKVKRYIVTDKAGLMDWLRNGGNSLDRITPKPILEALGAAPTQEKDDKRAYFKLNALFALKGSLLIRSGSKLPDVVEKGQPDTVHLRSQKVLRDERGNSVRDNQGKLKKKNEPVVSGTSVTGVLRHRAVKICNTLKDNSGDKFVEQIFGVDMKKLKERNENKETKELPFASRLEVKETFIENTNDLVQTRVKIDRFTGGAFEGALFDAAPVFAKRDGKALEISLKLRCARLTKENEQPETVAEMQTRTEAEIGLLLLLLKDLWTSDLPIGGESSIGRGRLKGISASLLQREAGADKLNVVFDQTLNVSEENREKLNGFVTVLKNFLEN